jgi:hypothetical protein
VRRPKYARERRLGSGSSSWARGRSAGPLAFLFGGGEKSQDQPCEDCFECLAFLFDGTSRYQDESREDCFERLKPAAEDFVRGRLERLELNPC